MGIVFVALSAFVGGLAAGLLGWLEKKSKWSAVKFLPTLIRSVIAGGGIAISYPFLEDMGLWPAVIAAFLVGAGVDVLGHRVAGSTGK